MADYKQSIREAVDDIRLIKSELLGLQNTVISVSQAASNALKGSFKIKDTDELEKSIILVRDEVRRLIAVTNEYSNKSNKLTEAEKRRNTAIQEQINLMAKNQNTLKSTTREQNSYVQAMKKAWQQKDKLARAYMKLVAEQRKARDAYRDLIVSKGKNNKETKKAQIEYKKLTKRVNEANKATSNFSKTGLGSAVRGFKNLIGAFGIAGGIMLFRDFTMAVFNNLKELDKLEFSLKAVLKNEGELIRTQEFLNRITIQYGAELVSTTERYTKFMVAARNAGLEMKQVESIFETMTEAAGVMGLKTDELTGIYLALEQMLSKGKVTTEELRRQLGERLPGAFDLAAKAMGKSTAEFDKMLKSGEVIAADLLPKLRVEIEQAFGLENIDKVTTLQASVTNLKTSWQQLINSFRTGAPIINTILIGSFELLGGTLRDLADIILGVQKVAERESFSKMFSDLQDANKSIEEAEGLLTPLKKRLEEVGEENEKLTGRYEGQIKAVENYIKLKKEEKSELINDIENKKEERNIVDEKITLTKLEKMSIEQLREVLKSLNVVQEDTVGWHKEQITKQQKILDQQKDREGAIKVQQKIADHERAITEILGEKAKAQKKVMEGSLEHLSNMISLLEKEQTTLSTSHEEYAERAEKIEALKDEYESLKSLLETGMDVGVFELDELIDIEELEQQAEELDGLFNSAIFDGMDLLSETTGADMAELFAEFNELYEWDYQNFLKFAEKKIKAHDKSEKEQRDALIKTLEFAGEVAGAIGDLVSTMFERKAQKYEDDIERNRDYYAELLDTENLTEEQRSALEAERDRKERELEKKKRAEERKAAIAQKAAAVTESIINTSVAYTKSLGQGGLILGLPWATAVAALGAIQTATILAQPIPKYEKGKGKYDNYEGAAIWGEKKREAKISTDGTIELSPRRIGNHLTHVKKDDIIHPDANKLLSNMSMEELQRHTVILSSYNDERDMEVYLSMLELNNSVKEQTNSIVTAIEKNRTKLNIKQRIDVGDDLNFLAKLNDV